MMPVLRTTFIAFGEQYAHENSLRFILLELLIGNYCHNMRGLGQFPFEPITVASEQSSKLDFSLYLGCWGGSLSQA